MAAKTDPINTSNPAGSSDPKQGDDYIRTLAKALIELLTVDHYVGAANPWGSDASGDETGEHVKVTFHEAISDPSVAAGDGVLYIKGDPPELYFRDEDDGNVIKFTSGGEILFGSLSSIAKNTYLKAINNAGDGTIDLIKGNASDKPVIKAGAELSTSGDPTAAAGIVCKEYADDYADAAPKAQMKADNVGGATFGAGDESVTLPNGMIIKAGYQADAGAVTTVTFGDAFPGGILSVTVTTKDDVAQTTEPVINTVGVALFKIESNEAVDGYYWVAIGY